MKNKITLLLMALFLGTGSITAAVVTTISDNASWKAFVASVSAGDDYSSTTVTLTADVVVDGTVSETTVGTTDHKFNGTFDGQGYTLTFNKTGITGLSNVAPFKFINGATIKNLKTAGTLEANQGLMAGIVSEASGTSTISNCSSSMTITCTATSNPTNGGILARGDNSSTIVVKNCCYSGTMTAVGGVSGIVGYFRNGSGATLSNVLFAGSITCTNNSEVRNLYRDGSGTTTSNIYYITAATGGGTAATDGTQATSANLLNGELAYTLASADNTGNTLFWGQGNLNKSNIEAYPNLTTNAAKIVKKVKISGMGTAPCVNPGGAAPNPCRFGKLGYKLNDSDANTIQNMPSTSEFNYVGTTTEGELKTTTGMYCVTLTAAATTLILPFDCNTLPDGITAYDVTYSSGDAVTATQVTKITADKPVLINGTAGTTYKFTGTFGGTFSGTLSDGVKAHTNGALTGVYVDANASSGYNPIAYVPANSYVLQNKSGVLGFYQVENANTVRITSFRAYLTAQSANPARRLTITFDDNNTTGIKNISEQTNNDDAIYTLNGTRVDHPVKGLYIKNGKKFIVK